eukprot:scaffold10109_cov116-Isochrysis_galbana.AAC.2
MPRRGRQRWRVHLTQGPTAPPTAVHSMRGARGSPRRARCAHASPVRRRREQPAAGSASTRTAHASRRASERAPEAEAPARRAVRQCASCRTRPRTWRDLDAVQAQGRLRELRRHARVVEAPVGGGGCGGGSAAPRTCLPTHGFAISLTKGGLLLTIVQYDSARPIPSQNVRGRQALPRVP